MNETTIATLKGYKPIPRHIAEKTFNYKLLAEFTRKRRSRTECSSMPLPGPLKDCFPASGIEINTWTVRPMKAGDWAILQKLDSSIIKQAMMGAAYSEEVNRIQKSGASDAEKESELAKVNDKYSKEAVTVPLEDMIAGVYLFTRSPKEVYEQLSKGGRDSVMSSAIEAIGNVDVDLLGRMFQAAQGQIERSFTTAVKYGSGGDEGTRFFQDSAQVVTALDGGQN